MDALDKEIHDKEANPNIYLTTICPASMSTGMFQTFTSQLPWLLPISDPEQIAQSAVEAILLNKKLAIVPTSALVCLKLTK